MDLAPHEFSNLDDVPQECSLMYGFIWYLASCEKSDEAYTYFFAIQEDKKPREGFPFYEKSLSFDDSSRSS